MLEDGIAVEAILTKLSAESIKFKVNEAILNGIAGAQPTGLVPHPSTVVIAKESGQAANTINFQNIVKMNQALMSAKGIWIANKDTEQQLMQIQDAAGRFLYFAPGTLPGMPEARLLGKSIKYSQNAQTLGTKGDLICADLSGYALGYRSTGVNRAISFHLYFNTDEMAYRWTFRVDGRPWRDEPLAAAHGNATYSQAVVLATRGASSS